MSLVKACCVHKKKVVVICPTIRLIRAIEEQLPEIIGRKPKIASILSNPELCRKLNPNLRIKFQFKPSCENCEYNNPESCPLQKILCNDYDVYLLTIDKLRALQISDSPEAKEILKKILECEVFLFDEFCRAILVSVPSLDLQIAQKELKKTKETIKINNYDQQSFFDNGYVFLEQFKDVDKDGVYNNSWCYQFSDDQLRNLFFDFWQFLTKLTEEGIDTSILQDLAILMFSREIVVSHQNGTVKLTAKLEDALAYLRNFIKEIDPSKTIFLVDSFLPNLNYEEILGKSVNHKFWGSNGDPLQTNKKQIIICDTAHWGSENFINDRKLQERTRRFIKELLDLFPQEKILIVCTNKKIAKIISKWHLPDNVDITWFRSDLMRGVPVGDHRIMVCVGGPYLPKDAYVAPSESFKYKDFAKEMENLTEEEKRVRISRFLTYIDTNSEFINAIGRVKDPLAKKRSVVFTLGSTIFDVRALLRRPDPFRVSQPYLAKPYAKGGFMRDGLLIAQIWMMEHPERYLYPSYDYAYTGDVKDLPLLARLIRVVNEKVIEKIRAGKKPEVTASEVVPGKAYLIVDVAKQYKKLLMIYRVKMKKKRGGVAFTLSWVNLEDFISV